MNCCTAPCVHTDIICPCPACTGSNGQSNEGSKGLVLLRLMPPERLLLCGGRPLNTEPEAGALEITVLRVSEIASAILIMSPPLIPYVHWLPERGKREGRLSQSPRSQRLIRCPPPPPLTSSDSLKKYRYQKTPSSVSCPSVLPPARVVLNIFP